MSRYPWNDHRHCRFCNDEALYPSPYCEYHRSMRKLENLIWQAPLLTLVAAFVVLAIQGNW